MTKKWLTDKISVRLLGLDNKIKSDNKIKPKGIKCVAKKLLPEYE